MSTKPQMLPQTYLQLKTQFDHKRPSAVYIHLKCTNREIVLGLVAGESCTPIVHSQLSLGSKVAPLGGHIDLE